MSQVWAGKKPRTVYIRKSAENSAEKNEVIENIDSKQTVEDDKHGIFCILPACVFSPVYSFIFEIDGE